MKVARRAFLGTILFGAIAGPGSRSSASTKGRVLRGLSCRAWIANDLSFNGNYRITAALVCEALTYRVYTPLRFGSLGFLFAIQDDGGKWLATPNAPQPHPFAPQHPIPLDSFTKLEGGMLIGAYTEGAVRDVFPSPGNYTVSTTYRSPISTTALSNPFLQFKDEVVVREDGTIFAPTVKVKVR